PFRIQRNGKPMQLNVTLEHRDAKDYVSPPYNLDQPPRYYVLGGLIFQELSRQYLKEWGPNWQREAPQRLVYFDRFQSELFPAANLRVVILSQVLPANSTIRYDGLAYLTVTKVNGREINSLADLADVGQLASAGLEKSNCLAATGCARVSRRNVRRAGTSDTVVPLRNSLARGNTEEQAPNRVDIVILEIDALQPGIVPVQFFRVHK